VKKNGEYLISLINDILDLSKIEDGKLDTERISCSPQAIIADVTSLMRVRATAKRLSLEVRYEGTIPELIQTDPTRLRQVLINIVGNAIKFTEAGSVEIVTCLANEPAEDPKLKISVVDTGIGITESQCQKLFLPFTQADSSTTRRFGGTGLGLTISKRLTEALGGTISTFSTVGKGTTFVVTVSTGPLDDVKWIHNAGESVDEAPAEKSVDATDDSLRNRRILFAEDGPDNQRLIAFILKKAGAEVSLAENGQVALDLANAALLNGRPYDVILMDMQMPVLDGYSATSLLREQGYAGPIIALTANAMAGDREKCITAGCDDFATKPVNRKMLVSIVGRYASRGLSVVDH